MFENFVGSGLIIRLSQFVYEPDISYDTNRLGFLLFPLVQPREQVFLVSEIELSPLTHLKYLPSLFLHNKENALRCIKKSYANL